MHYIVCSLPPCFGFVAAFGTSKDGKGYSGTLPLRPHQGPQHGTGHLSNFILSPCWVLQKGERLSSQFDFLLPLGATIAKQGGRELYYKAHGIPRGHVGVQ